jgi:CubicO group peptidase (beta-lactamase class C family)
VAEKGKILYAGAFGYSNLKTKDTLNVNTPFQLASVSKMFTATAIMLLYDKGLLEYDEDVRKYIPEFPTCGITIRNLLNHRSGLQNYIYVADRYWDRSKVITNNDIPALFKNNNIKPAFPANHHFNYCNTNYALLALVVEKISGFTFTDFMKTFIFTPLKMNNSYIYCKADDNFMKGSAVGFSYFYRGGMKAEVPDYLDGVTGDKGMYSSVEDLYLFDQALYQCRLMKPSVVAEAFTASPDDNGKTKKYGFGWRIRMGDDQKKEVYHYGWWRGFRTYFIREMTDKITVISLNNRSNVHINNILCQILWYGEQAKTEGVAEETEE